MRLFILLVWYSFAICALMFSGCSESPSNRSNQADIETIDFNDLKSIQVELLWSDDYSISRALIGLIIPAAFAALPPESQPHYQLSLVFDHPNKTISDTYKSFTGIDSASMTVSRLVRGSSVYQQFEAYLETTYLCRITEENPTWVGPQSP